jgi:hypothetical protein
VFAAEEGGRNHNARLGLGVALDAAPVHTLRLGEADTDAQVVEVDVPAAEAGQLFRPHRTVRAEGGRHEESVRVGLYIVFERRDWL